VESGECRKRITTKTVIIPLANTIHYQLSAINYSLALAGLWENGGIPTPAVALRFTAGYAVHTPSGVKSEKQKFH
jgi:hypothetical protein